MASITFWGLTASPYQLKMQALADYCEVPWQRVPDQASTPRAIAMLLRLRLARSRGRVQRFPQYTQGMDEYPAVPFYTLDGKQFYYDSTGLALHLDYLQLAPHPLLPEDAAIRFLCCLIDEAFDEFGLYMVHHNRWVTSARTNVMGAMTAREMAHWLPAAVRRNIARRLARRQSRRCPYLFSVAPPAFDAGVEADITPPSREGFPATYELLDQAWRDYLAAMEQMLSRQPYLLGERFTLADASAYGQLSMNLVDGRAADLLQELAPRAYRWLCAIRDGEHRGSRGHLRIDDSLDALISCIGETFIPLMQQNAVAWERHYAGGQRRFNEAAFDHGEALYDGELLGKPFRAVAKSFQVVVWRELLAGWGALGVSERSDLVSRFPGLRGLADVPAPA